MRLSALDLHHSSTRHALIYTLAALTGVLVERMSRRTHAGRRHRAVRVLLLLSGAALVVVVAMLRG